MKRSKKEQSEIPLLSSGTTIYLLVLLHDVTSTKPGNPRVFPVFFRSPISKTGVMEASGDRISSLSMDTMSKKRASLSTVKEELYPVVVSVFCQSIR